MGGTKEKTEKERGRVLELKEGGARIYIYCGCGACSNGPHALLVS